MVRFRRLAGGLTVALGMGLLTAQAADAGTSTVVIIDNPTTTHTYRGSTFTVVGFAVPNSTVVLHYHRAGTAPTDYSIERSVRSDSNGVWYREAKLDVDYRVFATVGTGNPHSGTVLFTAASPSPVTISNPGTTKLPFGQPFTVKGTAAPYVPVVVHYRRTSAPAVDIPRTVYTDRTGHWDRTAVEDTSYTVFATVGTANPHSSTVLFAGHQATVGDVLDIDVSPTSGPDTTVVTTVGTQLRRFSNTVPNATPAAGMRWVEVSVCVRNRGPEGYFYDGDTGSFYVRDSAGKSYSDTDAVGSEARINLSGVAIGELRCGGRVFEVPASASIVSFSYAPGTEPNYYVGRWAVSGAPIPPTAPAQAPARVATPAAPAATAPTQPATAPAPAPAHAPVG